MAKAKLGDIQLDDDGQDWRVYLTGKPPKRNTEVTSGYWRIVSSRGYATPVQTIFDDGVIQVKFPLGCPFLKDSPADIDQDAGAHWHAFVDEFWPQCEPVDYDDEWTPVIANGEWPDNVKVDPRTALGANNPPEEAADLMLKQARENLEKAKKLAQGGKAKNQKAADAAAVLEKAMSTQRASLKEFHEAEKEPHLEASRKVDARFLPLIKDMVAAGKDINEKVKRPFLQEQEDIARRAREAAQKVIDDAAAEAAAEAAKNAPTSPLDEGWEEAQPSAPRIEISTPKVSAGVRGARSSLRDVRYGVIIDLPVFAAKLVEHIRFYPELQNLLDTMALRMARGEPAASAKDGEVIFPGLKLEIRRE